MHAYVTCRPDFGYAITVTNKFSIKLSKLHYELLKGIVRYLLKTKNWGIKYKRSVDRDDLAPVTLASDMIPDENLPSFPVDINQPKLMAFFDTAYANDQRKHQSTTGFVFTIVVVLLYTVPKHNPLLLLILLKQSFLLQFPVLRLFCIYNWSYTSLVSNTMILLLSLKIILPPS